jgi:hypothetical protein
MLIAASELCPEKKDLLHNVGLLWMTMQQKAADILNNLHDQRQNKVSLYKYYSVTIDESTVIKDTAQHLVFAQYTQITDDLAGMRSMHGCTPREEISNEVVKFISEGLNLSLNLLIGIFTDGAYVTGYVKWRFQGT